jgi:hypothetical protein
MYPGCWRCKPSRDSADLMSRKSKHEYMPRGQGGVGVSRCERLQLDGPGFVMHLRILDPQSCHFLRRPLSARRLSRRFSISSIAA